MWRWSCPELGPIPNVSMDETCPFRRCPRRLMRRISRLPVRIPSLDPIDPGPFNSANAACLAKGSKFPITSWRNPRTSAPTQVIQPNTVYLFFERGLLIFNAVGIFKNLIAWVMGMGISKYCAARDVHKNSLELSWRIKDALLAVKHNLCLTQTWADWRDIYIFWRAQISNTWVHLIKCGRFQSWKIEMVEARVVISWEAVFG